MVYPSFHPHAPVQTGEPLLHSSRRGFRPNCDSDNQWVLLNSLDQLHCEIKSTVFRCIDNMIPLNWSTSCLQPRNTHGNKERRENGAVERPLQAVCVYSGWRLTARALEDAHTALRSDGWQHRAVEVFSHHEQKYKYSGTALTFRYVGLKTFFFCSVRLSTGMMVPSTSYSCQAGSHFKEPRECR